jgi:hypothetical protein
VDTQFLILETLVVFGLVLGIHASRRRTSIVYSYAILTFLTFGSWVTSQGIAIDIGPFDFYVASGVFFTGALLSVFVLYVADGPRADWPWWFAWERESFIRQPRGYSTHN